MKLLRHVLMVFVAVFVLAGAASAQECQICGAASDPNDTVVFCTWPPNDSWGYEYCTVTAHNGFAHCHNGLPMCYYFEVY